MGNKTPTPKPAGKSPDKPKSGFPIGGTSPSKPKSPVPAPPQAPKLPRLPQLPKPKSGGEPPKGSLPDYTPGYAPYHGSGGHQPVSGGDHNQDHGKASSTHSCIHPKGLARLRCQKADAVVVTLIAIIGLFLVPFLIYKFIRSCKRRRTKKKNRHVEDGMELTSRPMNCDPSPHIDRGVLDGNFNIGLAISTSEETFQNSLIKEEQTQDMSSPSSPAENSCPAESSSQPRTRNLSPGRKTSKPYPPRTSLNRGRPRFRARSLESVASSLSSGMIRTAMLGEALQDPTIIDVPPSFKNLQKTSECMSSSGDADISNNDDDGRRDSGEEEGGRGYVESNMENGDIQKEEAASHSGSSSRKSTSFYSPDDRSDCAVDDIPGLSASTHTVSDSDSSFSANPGDDL